jgi:hypothetical protein
MGGGEEGLAAHRRGDAAMGWCSAVPSSPGMISSSGELQTLVLRVAPTASSSSSFSPPSFSSGVVVLAVPRSGGAGQEGRLGHPRYRFIGGRRPLMAWISTNGEG